MKRRCLVLLFALFLIVLSGCGKKTEPETRIFVSILETPGVTVENNGQYIQSGEDVVFLLKMDDGFALANTDYDGKYQLSITGKTTKLTLKNVRYPKRVGLVLTETYGVIKYEPNGGVGETTTIVHDTANHRRPNTSNGRGLFSRDGYTLESWNTLPDGTGERIGLGSRATVPQEGLTLYAQWAKWSDAHSFQWEHRDEGVVITNYHGQDAVVVIPAVLDGEKVSAIAADAFQNCTMQGVILPETMVTVEDGAFQNCALETLTIFDSIENISDGSFLGCEALKTLRINAVEPPYGFDYRRESWYADKVDLLIAAQDQKKIIFYGGCSIWYNLDGTMLTPLLEQGYQVVNMGINGVVNSMVQMQIIEQYLRPGDIFFHTPEISSPKQLLAHLQMEIEKDDKLWCGLEYNYDLFTLVDLRSITGGITSFCDYLSIKESATSYTETFTDEQQSYCDEFGCIPFERTETKDVLDDEVHLNVSYMTDTAQKRLQEVYSRYQQQGVRVYISYACTNMDSVPEEERGCADMVRDHYRKFFDKMDSAVLISELYDFLYVHEDFAETNYHLLSSAASRNTEIWLRDLQAQMEKDGLWEAP